MTRSTSGLRPQNQPPVWQLPAFSSVSASVQRSLNLLRGENHHYARSSRMAGCFASSRPRADNRHRSQHSHLDQVAPVTGRAGSGVARWFGWGGLLLVAALGAASSGVGGLFVLSGLFVLVVGVVALLRGRVSWAMLSTRAAGGVAVGAAIALIVVGAVTTDAPTPSVTTPSSSTPPAPTSTSSSSTSSATTSSPLPSVSSSTAPSTTSSPPAAKPLPLVSKESSPAAPRRTPAPSKTSRRPAPPKPLPVAPQPADVYYPNCAAVRAAGADPIRVGQPGYSLKLDRDGDGIACE